MKLLKLQINSKFRSLPAGFCIEFRKFDEDFFKNLHEPICLVGVNGAGKSNVLEALAEIFSYIDQTFLRYVSAHSDSPIINSFELEYLLPFTYGRSFVKLDGSINYEEKLLQIRITKEEDLKPRFFWILKSQAQEISPEDYISALPDRIIGYSSGQNELLSVPFYRTRFRYYNNIIQEQKAMYKDAVEYSRLRYIDYDENTSILLANYLMERAEEVTIFREKLQIDNIADFEITINQKLQKNGALKVDQDIEKLLDFFRSNCSLRTVGANGVETLKFSVTKDLKKEFQENFLDSSGLYTLFKRLGYLNLNSIKRSHINSLLTKQEEIYEKYVISDFTPEQKFFQISSINIKKQTITNPISYRSLSDGEHQFIHILGTLLIMKHESTLFLFDEPETHFNPKWKYEYTETFKKIANELNSQILLTTHDPVLISGLSKENVLIFNKPEDSVNRTYKPDKDLRGMGVDAILTSEIFGLNATLDSKTLNEIIDRRKLLAKNETEILSGEESEKLDDLSKKLIDIDFNVPFADPLYKDFILAIENLDVYKRTDLTHQEIKERQSIATEIMKKLMENGF